MRVRTVQVSGRVRPTDRPQKRALFMGWAMGDGRFRVVFQCYRALTPPVLPPQYPSKSLLLLLLPRGRKQWGNTAVGPPLLPPSLPHVSYDLARNQPTVALPRKTSPVATAAAVISAEDTLDSDTFTLIPFRPSFLSFLPPL